MKIISSPEEMYAFTQMCRKDGKAVALVPTMGALHNGHTSLVSIGKKLADSTVMSIFVNPTQFGPKEDFSKYPRPFEDDCRKAEEAGCDVVFAPSKECMYPESYNTYVSVENITEKLCGASRPGHFRGVTTVVLKLFNIVNPSVAIFGQKDAQQVLVIKQMVKDLNHPVRIEVAPIIREYDGLAMSSRNVYLTASERAEAAVIYKSLQCALEYYNGGERSTSVIINQIKHMASTWKFINIEYIEIVDVINLQTSENIPSPALIAIACRTKQSGTRLIDNVVAGGTM